MAYVSVSRGQWDAQIFTNDREKLTQALSHDVSHKSAFQPEQAISAVPLKIGPSPERVLEREHGVWIGFVSKAKFGTKGANDAGDSTGSTRSHQDEPPFRPRRSCWSAGKRRPSYSPLASEVLITSLPRRSLPILPKWRLVAPL